METIDPAFATVNDLTRWASNEEVEALVEVLDVLGCYAYIEERRLIESPIGIWGQGPFNRALFYYMQCQDNERLKAVSLWTAKQAERGRSVIDILFRIDKWIDFAKNTMWFD